MTGVLGPALNLPSIQLHLLRLGLEVSGLRPFIRPCPQRRMLDTTHRPGHHNFKGVQKAAIKNFINLKIRATNLSGSLSSLISVAELADSISQDSIVASVTKALTLSSVGDCLQLV